MKINLPGRCQLCRRRGVLNELGNHYLCQARKHMGKETPPLRHIPYNKTDRDMADRHAIRELYKLNRGY